LLSSFHPHGLAGNVPFEPMSILAATSVRSELLRTPSMRSSENSYSTHFGE
jgi:hypothetical protein